MTKRILDSRHPLMVYNPTGVFSAEYFDECHKAGALPVFDTEFFTDEEAIASIRTLAGRKIVFGVRTDGRRSAIVKAVRDGGFINCDALVLYFEGDLPESFEDPGQGVKVLLELVDFHSDAALAFVEPHAVVLRGFEAGGRASRFSSFIIMQWYLENSRYPVFMHGGVGFHTTPGIFAAGCSGVVLDSQLYLSDEAPLSDNFKKQLLTVEEGDSTFIGEAVGRSYRFFNKLATKVTKELKDQESFLQQKSDGGDLLYKEISSKIVKFNDASANPIQSLFFLGQDGVFAKHFASRSKKVGQIIRAFIENAGVCLRLVDEFDPLKEGTALAKEHNTTYPIIQGPMANISDNADFAHLVYKEGSLPFFAMGNLPGNLAEKIIADGKAKCEFYGCGLIGLATNVKAFNAHFELLKKYNVPYALIAAGNAAQANELEAAGVRCYLHCPSSMMLENAIKGGVKRFIFEGMEAGGHIGTLASFALWEMAMEKFLTQPEGALAEQKIIFAGGLGTPSSSDFIAGMTSVLASKGAAVGISVGTTYLFTKEIVETGAIKPLYQKVLIEKNETTVIGSTLGLSTRTVNTVYSKRIIEKEHEMIREKVPLTDRKHYFEKQNVGSLLIAAKAFTPNFDKLKAEGVLEYINYNEDEALDKGNYHTGESLAFYKNNITIADTHAIFFGRKHTLREKLGRLEIVFGGKNTINDEIAIIGMGCVYPDAPDVNIFWKNILDKKNSIHDISAERLNPDYYYSEDKKAEDKSYTKIAGIIENYSFDYKKYGYNDDEDKHMSRSQKLVLEAAMQAAEHAGYANGKGLPKHTTGVVVGSCLTNELNSFLQLTRYYPEFVSYINNVEEFKSLPDADKQEFLDSFKKNLLQGYSPKLPDGCALNVEASRITKHLGVEGTNFVIDAACATSFAAIDVAVNELLTGDSDVMVVGGVNTNLSPEAFVGFSKMGALSAQGSFPFDERAGGFVLGEGAGVVILKRMKDALADGDTIHAVIKGVGSSSDGKGKFIAAPSAEGQKLALLRAYENMRSPINPDDIDYIEAHGTSTVVGDGLEFETIKSVYGVGRQKGVSSVKSQVGHLLGGAGNAGLIKAICALEHKILPPNGQFEKISPKIKVEGSSLFIIDNEREWKTEAGRKRRAAVSSYGFGGINYHMIIEEYDGNYKILPRTIFNDPDYDFNMDRIVVTGIGTVLPDTIGKDALWQVLESGKSIISEKGSARFNNASYFAEKDPLHHIEMIRMGVAKNYVPNGIKYKISPMVQKVVDRAQFFALDAAGQVFEDAKIADKLINGNRIALMFGTAASEKNCEQIIRTRIPFITDMMSKAKIDESVKKTIIEKFTVLLKADYHKNTEDTLPGLLANITTGRVANFYNTNGANFIIDAECAASAVAISAAMKDLKAGSSDFVIAGGVDANLTPATISAFNMLKVISTKDFATIFDKTSSGLVMSEGAALMCLTTLRKAKETGAKIYAELDGFAFRSFPNENIIAPTENGFLRLFSDFYGKSSVSNGQISYVDGFASSNKVVDKWELNALNKTYRKGTLLGNAKTELGYYRTANPAVVMTRLAMMVSNRTISAMHSFNPETTMLDGTINLCGSKNAVKFDRNKGMYLAANFSGLGGLHGHGVMRTLPLWLENAADMPANIGMSSSVSAVSSVQTAAAAKGVQICALLSGQGSQFGGMMKPLYDSEPVIKAALDKGEAIFKASRGYSILELMFGANDALNSTENTQPAIFLSTAALFDYLSAKGLVADRFIGHSIGEYSALYCAGILSFEDALKCIIKRSEIMKKAATEKKGAIMVVFAGADDTAKFIVQSGAKDAWIANKNSEKQTAVSGTSEGIDALAAYLAAQKITAKKLNLSGAFHSPLFAEAAAEMKQYLAGVKFNAVDYTKIISNVTGKRHAQSESELKELLVKQIASPVEFVNSVKFAASEGAVLFVEIGPNKLLSNLMRDISVSGVTVVPAVDPKAGESISLAKCVAAVSAARAPQAAAIPAVSSQVSAAYAGASGSVLAESASFIDSSDFNEFMEKNRELVTRKLYEEYEKQKRGRENEFFKRAGFYGGSIVISGAAIGLPGKMNRVFEENNFDKILSGMNLIEPVEESVKQKIVDRKIVKVHKDPQGNAKFINVTGTDEVIQLAGQLGFFDPKEYGIEFDFDKSYTIAMAAGLEALRDAHIPLVPMVETTSVGSKLDKGYALPVSLQERTGVIFTTAFSGLDTVIDDIERLEADKFHRGVFKEFEKMYFFLMSRVADEESKREVTEWYMKLKTLVGNTPEYKFERNIIFNIIMNANAQLAEMIRAKGPNSQTNAACASVTQGIGIANDWIRTGRCDRVVVISGETATSNVTLPLVGGGMFALGAASVKKVVSEAAKPFDEDRNGLIAGSGAVGIVVERQDSVRERGFNGLAEVLGVHVKNSAFHGSRLDVNHIAQEMKAFVDHTAALHGIDKNEIADKLVFMSHETYTPARGGSADAEVEALKASFPGTYQKITITNTKGYTGHTMGAGIEDPVLVKGLIKGKVPPIANLVKIPANFRDLKFSKGEQGNFQYGIHFAAGFGSQFAILFIKRLDEKSVSGNDTYQRWIEKVSGVSSPEITMLKGALTVKGTPSASGAGHAPSAQKSQPAQAAPAKAAAPAGNVLGDIKGIIAEMTGYSIDMLDERLDLEADLGIDTVKQVEIFGKVCEKFGMSVPEDIKLTEFNTIEKLAGFIGGGSAGTGHAPSVQGSASSGSANVLADIKGIIAEMTGYGVEMLDERLDLEADLGIDTVKQVEIFGKVCEKFGMSVPEDIKLTEFNTIEKLAGFIGGGSAGTVDAPSGSAEQGGSKPARTETAPAANVLADIKGIIAEMTGYGVEMLDERLDLEADLGIDTVKQVEIFGKVCEKFGMSVPEDIKLTEFNTIEKLGGFIAGNTAGAGQTLPVQGSAVVSAAAESKPSSIGRYVVRTESAKMPSGESFSFEGKTILITDDGKGLAKKIGAQIESRKGKALYLGKDCDVNVSMGDLEALDTATKALAEKGGIDGIIHCAHLRSYFNGQKIDNVSINEAVKGYFITVKNLYNVLNKKGSLIAAPIFESMVFAYADPKAKIYPLSGSVTGFMKSVRKELKDTLVKAVDFSIAKAETKFDEIAEMFVKEIVSGDTRIEIGYKNGERFRTILVDEAPAKEAPFVKDGDTVLVTGGARGITFEILKGLVSKYKVNLVICARSDIKVDAEFAKPGMNEQDIFTILAAKMAGAKPVDIKKAVAKVKGQLEASNNIKTLESLGAKVEYHAHDVTDAKAISSVVAGLEKIDGIIHAAGFEESQLIPRKDMKTFNAVFDTKIFGALNLLEALKGKEYRFFIGFSSVAARFGNDGQSDYSAANEMLCRLLQREKRSHADRAYKVFDWTAWGEVGMATKEAVIKFLSAQGVEFLPVKTGVEFFLNDLTDPKEDEVVITNQVPAFDRDGLFSKLKKEHGSSKAPFLGKALSKGADEAKWNREFVITNDTFFDHHTKDGVPLFLGATGLEMMAEASTALNEGKWLSEVSDFSIPYSIKLLQGKPKEIISSAKKNADGSVNCELQSVFMKDGKMIGQPTLHYKGTYTFADKKPKGEKITLPELKKITWDGKLSEVLYHPKRLFMEELFQTIDDVIGMSEDTLVTKLQNRSKVPFFAHINDPEFLIDPVVVDGIFQTGGLFEFLGSGDTILPYRISKLTMFKKIDTHGEYICLTKLVGRDDVEKTRTFNVELLDADGNLCLRIEKFQMIVVGKLPEEVSIKGMMRVVG